MTRIFLLSAMLIATIPAMAQPPDDTEGRCVDIAIAKKAVADTKGEWTDLSSGQWEFARGLFILNPNTAQGLPIGGKAALATGQDVEKSLVFFLDGARACDVMVLPKVIVQFIRDVGAGIVKHEGTVD